MKTDNYIIKEDGRIISKKTGNPLRPHLDKKGYNRVRLKHDGTGKTYLVHRVIATYFLENPDNLPQVNHKDGDKSNNCVSNLEWVTGKQNVEHSVKNNLIKRGQDRPNSKLTDEDVIKLRKLREQGLTYYVLGDMFGISYQTAHMVATRKTYKHIK